LNALEEEQPNEGHDLELERRLVSDHLKDLEMNRYPQISKKLDRPIEQIKPPSSASAACILIRQSRSAWTKRPHHPRRDHLSRRGDREI